MQNVSNLQIPEGVVRTIHNKDGRLIWGRLAYDTKYAGDTVQDGTPTPNSPIAIQAVTGEQTITISDGIDSEAFPVNLGSLELCKIGDYQDYIYKSGDGWYVHKDIGKVDIVSSGIAAFNTHSGSHITVNYSDANVERLSAPAVTNISNRFIGCTTTQTWSGSVLNGVSQGTNNNYLQFSLPISVATTQAEVRTYFSNHPTTVYYTLSSPTDTQITDATLVGQLNAVHEWLTRYDYNATVTGNLPIIINKTNL